VTWRQPALLARTVRGHERSVVHLHGLWSDPDSIDLVSYEQIVGNELLQTALRALVFSKTLVFVVCGAGLDDYNFAIQPTPNQWTMELRKLIFNPEKARRTLELLLFHRPRSSEWPGLAAPEFDIELSNHAQRSRSLLYADRPKSGGGRRRPSCRSCLVGSIVQISDPFASWHF